MMKRNQGRGLGLTALILAVASVLFLLGCPRPGGVKVGAVLPMTGSGARYGKSMQRGIDLAVEDINAAGGINGKKLKVITVDSKSDNTAGANAATRLINVNKVPAIITVLAGVTQAIIPVTEKNKVLLFTAATEPGLTEQGRYVFRNATYIRNEIDRMLKACREKLNLRKVAVLYMNNPAGAWANDYIKKGLESFGGQVTASESFQPEAIDLSTQLERIKLTSPEAVYLLAGKQSGPAMKLARQLGLKCQFLGTSDFELPEVLPVAGAAAEGAIYTSVALDPANGNGPLVSFKERYQKRYGEDPEVFSATAYDATGIIAKVLRNAGSDPDSARDHVLSIRDYPGVTGITSFLPNGDANKPVELKKVENGGSVLLP
jgi:branched-chain amino acid transport system substrate-binding protein